MSMYIPVIVWTLSAGICDYIATKKNIKPPLLWNVTFAILGPLAMLIILSTKKIELKKDVKNNSVTY